MEPAGKRLEAEALVVGYAMSRLDRLYLHHRSLTSWRAAFGEAGSALGAPPASFKNLRDEFDPVHGNSRKGWRLRPLRPNRQRVLADLCQVEDAALLELVDRILARDEPAILPAIESLVRSENTAGNVAERLLTGRRAEEFFMEHCESVAGVRPSDLLDRRNSACGYDFGVCSDPDLAIEVKGLRGLRGDILFTDREWAEAQNRGERYWLVVVGGLDAENAIPLHRLLPNPRSALIARCTWRRSVSADWRARISVGK